MLYLACPTNKAITLLLSWRNEDLKLQEKLTFAYVFSINCSQSQKKATIRELYISKLLYTRCSKEKTMKLLPSRRTSNFLKKLLHIQIDFYICTFSQRWQIKIRGIESRHLHSLKAIYRVFHEKSSASFTEHLIFKKKSTFVDALWINIKK